MDFKLFKDKELKQEVDSTIDLGKLKAGEKKKFEFYVQNSSIHPYEEMEVFTDDSEVKVISNPKQLSEKASGLLVLEWSPSTDIKEGLKARLEIHGYKVIG